MKRIILKKVLLPFRYVNENHCITTFTSFWNVNKTWNLPRPISIYLFNVCEKRRCPLMFSTFLNMSRNERNIDIAVPNWNEKLKMCLKPIVRRMHRNTVEKHIHWYKQHTQKPKGSCATCAKAFHNRHQKRSPFAYANTGKRDNLNNTDLPTLYLSFKKVTPKKNGIDYF